MENYSYLNSLLIRKDSTYQEFEHHLTRLAVQEQTYLNLFLVTVVTHKAHAPDLEKYVKLLTSFHSVTGKKSADINYIGYKDRKNILMHAAHRGTPRAVEVLLNYKIETEVRDPMGKTAAFYAIRNSNEQHAIAILGILLNRFPKLLFIEAFDGATLLHEAIQTLRIPIVELLLKKGANPNNKIKSSGNTGSHELLKLYHNNKQAVFNILSILCKFKANFQEPNNEGVTVSLKAKQQGINFQEYVTICSLLEKDESAVDELDNEFDKISLTTLNQPTKGGDTRSQFCELDSQLQSRRVDFSQLDELNLNNPEPKDAQELVSDHEVLSESEEPTERLEGVDFEELSKQIMMLSQEQQQVHASMMPIVEGFLAALDKIAVKFNLSIDIVGSFATGLWTHSSDINVSLVPRGNQYINFEATLERIFKNIKSKKHQLQIQDIYFAKGKLSTIKITLAEKNHSLMFDIAVFHRNHMNKQYATYILESLAAFPQIKPLFFVIHRMCRAFGVEDPQTGGLKNYALFLMVNSVVKSMPTKNVGELFYHVVLYYGLYFEYGYDLQQPQAKVYDYLEQYIREVLEFPKMKFDLIDPFNHKNNVGGKNTKAKRVQMMFKAIYYWLEQSTDKPYLEQLYQLPYLF